MFEQEIEIVKKTPDEYRLEKGTVVKITEILKPHLIDAVHLHEGMEGVVWPHNDVFQIDPQTPALDQTGPVTKDEEMFMFEMNGSKLRVGPIGRMPDDHMVLVWVVAGKLWNVTSVYILFQGGLKWFVVRTGEILRLQG